MATNLPEELRDFTSAEGGADMTAARKTQKGKQQKLGIGGLALMAMLSGGAALNAGCSDSDELYPRSPGADAVTQPDSVGSDNPPQPDEPDAMTGDDSPFYVPDEITGDTKKDVMDAAEVCEVAQAKSFTVAIVNGSAKDKVAFGMLQDIEQAGVSAGTVDGCETTQTEPNCRQLSVEFNDSDTGKTFAAAYVVPAGASTLVSNNLEFDNGEPGSGGFKAYRVMLLQGGYVDYSDLKGILENIAGGVPVKSALLALEACQGLTEKDVTEVNVPLQAVKQDDIENPDFKSPGLDQDGNTNTVQAKPALYVVLVNISQDAPAGACN